MSTKYCIIRPRARAKVINEATANRFTTVFFHFFHFFQYQYLKSRSTSACVSRKRHEQIFVRPGRTGCITASDLLFCKFFFSSTLREKKNFINSSFKRITALARSLYTSAKRELAMRSAYNLYTSVNREKARRNRTPCQYTNIQSGARG